MGTVVTVPMNLGTVGLALPKPVDINVSNTAAEIIRFANEADSAEIAATRAVINSEEAFAKGADFVKACRARINELDEARLARTRAYADAKSRVDELYKAVASRITVAQTTVADRMRDWQKAEAKKRADEAAEKQRQIDADAKARAREQAISGDEAGAKEILTAAASVVVSAQPVRAVGMYGATAGSRKTRTGEVADLRKFLAALLARPEPELAVLLKTASFPQAELNKLARAIIDGKVPAVDGFNAVEKSDLDVR